MNVYDVLTERGFIKQVSHPEIRDILGSQSVTFYTGYDPTADSCHRRSLRPQRYARDDDKGYRGAQYPSVEKPDGAVFGFL